MSRRSVLFSPGDRPELQRKAPKSGADVVVFDLEDAVAPDRKAEARQAIHGVLTDPEFDPDCEVCVRVNPGETAAADLDIVLSDDPRIDSVMLPKVAEAGDVDRLAARLEAAGAELPVLAIVESAAGVLHAEAIAAADATAALCFGAKDLAADVGAERTNDGTEVLYAREHVVLAAAAAGVDAVDTLVTDFRAIDRLRDDAALSAQRGYDGKLAIHPDQVAPINEAFTPAPDRIEWAERVVAKRDEALAEAGDDGGDGAGETGVGVVEVDGEMIDAPLIAQAERILDRARAAGER